MRKTIVTFAVSLIAAGVLAAGAPAQAVPIVVTPSPNAGNVLLQTGGVDFWVTSCTYTVAGASTSCGGLALDPGASGPNNAEVSIQSATNGGSIFNIPAANFPLNKTYDLSVGLTVATVACVANPATCTPRIDSDAVSITGSAPSGDTQFLTAAETITLANLQSLPPITANVSQTQPGATASFAGQTNIFVTKDIGDQMSHIGGGLSQPVIITSVTQNFGLVPEPASMGIFLVSLAAIGVARRRRTRAIPLD